MVIKQKSGEIELTLYKPLFGLEYKVSVILAFALQG
jgi:hypothetical protein